MALLIATAIPTSADATQQAPAVARSLFEPTCIVSDGIHVWALDNGVAGLTELDATSGAQVRYYDSSSLQYDGYFYEQGAGPDACVASDGVHVWGPNNFDGFTQVNIQTGGVERVVKFRLPPQDGGVGDIFANGTHFWLVVANQVREYNASSGALQRVVGSAQYHFYPGPFSSDGQHLWVAGSMAEPGRPGAVMELDEQTGGVVRIWRSPRYGLKYPIAIASSGARLWLVCDNWDAYDNAHPTVTEISASTGALLHVYSGARYGLTSAPGAFGMGGIAADRAHVWIAVEGVINGGWVTELNARTGGLVRVMRAKAYGFKYPAGISMDGLHIWIANEAGNSVTELLQSTGSLVRVIHS